VVRDFAAEPVWEVASTESDRHIPSLAGGGGGRRKGERREGERGVKACPVVVELNVGNLAGLFVSNGRTYNGFHSRFPGLLGSPVSLLKSPKKT